MPVAVGQAVGASGAACLVQAQITGLDDLHTAAAIGALLSDGAGKKTLYVGGEGGAVPAGVIWERRPHRRCNRGAGARQRR